MGAILRGCNPTVTPFKNAKIQTFRLPKNWYILQFAILLSAFAVDILLS